MTEKSMVAKVSAAICEARNKFFETTIEHKIDGPDFDEVLARAAIEAMLTPTPEMEAAIKSAGSMQRQTIAHGHYEDEWVGDPIKAYKSGISEALRG